jgi:hypothetical protein
MQGSAEVMIEEQHPEDRKALSAAFRRLELHKADHELSMTILLVDSQSSPSSLLTN